MKAFARIFYVLLASLAISSPAIAQVADSTSFRRTEKFGPASVIVPGAFILSGVTIHSFTHDSIDMGVKNSLGGLLGDGDSHCFDDWLQYAPAVMDLGLSALGARADNKFTDRLIEAGIAYVACAAVALPIKHLIESPRPNGYPMSFPSGHSATVFTGAELVRLEYGWGWGAVAYGIAATVGTMRIIRDKHWLSDVLTGAGIGILCANAGAMLLQPTKRLFGLDSQGVQLSLSPSIDSWSGALCTAVCIRF